MSLMRHPTHLTVASADHHGAREMKDLERAGRLALGANTPSSVDTG